MRCPKCGFNSFDHNLACPKCRRDLADVRLALLLNLPAARPGRGFFAADPAAAAAAPVLESRPDFFVEREFAGPEEAGGRPVNFVELDDAESRPLNFVSLDEAEFCPASGATQTPGGDDAGSAAFVDIGEAEMNFDGEPLDLEADDEESGEDDYDEEDSAPFKLTPNQLEALDQIRKNLRGTGDLPDSAGPTSGESAKKH